MRFTRAPRASIPSPGAARTRVRNRAIFTLGGRSIRHLTAAPGARNEVEAVKVVRVGGIPIVAREERVLGWGLNGHVSHGDVSLQEVRAVRRENREP